MHQVDERLQGRVIRDTVRPSADLKPYREMFEYYNRQQNGDVHLPLTLDQSYYHSVGDTDDRNIDQVIFRHQARTTDLPERKRFICMVDQLWLLIINKSRSHSLTRQPTTAFGANI